VTERKDWIGGKLVAAYNHVERIHAEHTALVKSEDYGAVSDLNPDRGYLSVKVYGRRPPSPEWSIHAGEALYQWRSALDHVACLLAKERGEGAKDTTEFPIFLKREGFRNIDGTLTSGAKRDMSGISPEDQAAIEREQPFNRANGTPEDDPLWLLYLLSNYDRHQFLHLIDSAVWTGVTEFDPSWFAQHVTQIASNFGTFEGETEVSRFSISYDGPQITVKVKNNVSFGIVFGQEGPAAGLNVIATLIAIGMRVTEIVGRLLGVSLPNN